MGKSEVEESQGARQFRDLSLTKTSLSFVIIIGRMGGSKSKKGRSFPMPPSVWRLGEVEEELSGGRGWGRGAVARDG